MDGVDWALAAGLAVMVGGGSYLLGIKTGIELGIVRTLEALAEELKERNENDID